MAPSMDSKEPEIPVTGYSYHNFQNEGKILMRAARSAQKINRLKIMADASLSQHINRQNAIKINALTHTANTHKYVKDKVFSRQYVLATSMQAK